MTNAQKERVQFGIAWATEHIQEIIAKPDDAYKKMNQIDHQLLMMLEDVIEALPKALRVQAQACLQARHEVWKTELAEIDAYLAEIRKAQQMSGSLS